MTSIIERSSVINQSTSSPIYTQGSDGSAAGITNQNGVSIPLWTKQSAKSCLWIGDSHTRYGVRDRHPLIDNNRCYYLLSPTYTNLNGSGSFIKTTSAHPSCPTGNGTITYDKSARTLTWQANGDTAGLPVDASVGGHLKLESGSANATLYISCIPALAPTGSGTVSDTINVTGTRINTNMDLTGFSGWADLLLGCPFISGNYNYGIGGCTAADQLSWKNQWKDIYSDLTVVNLGTNGALTIASADTELAAVESIIRLRQGIGSTVILMTIFPRNSMTTTALRAWQYFNQGLRRLASSLNCDLADSVPYLAAAGGSGYFSADMTYDGTHLTGKGAYVAAKRALVPVMTKYIQPSATIISAGASYDASENVYGNLLTNGTLTGTAGSKGSGITSGTVATSMTASTGGLGIGTSLVVTAPDDGSPVSRTDNIRGKYQRFAINNTGGVDGRLGQLLQTSNITTNFTAGTDYIQLEGDLRISGTLLQYLTASADLSNCISQVITTSQPLYDLDGDTVTVFFRGRPMLIESGATTLNITIKQTMQANGVANFDIGQNLNLHKAIAS